MRLSGLLHPQELQHMYTKPHAPEPLTLLDLELVHDPRPRAALLQCRRRLAACSTCTELDCLHRMHMMQSKLEQASSQSGEYKTKDLTVSQTAATDQAWADARSPELSHSSRPQKSSVKQIRRTPGGPPHTPARLVCSCTESPASSPSAGAASAAGGASPFCCCCSGSGSGSGCGTACSMLVSHRC